MKAEIDQYLRTGDYDPLMLNWPGQNIVEMTRHGSKAFRAALLAEVRRRAAQVRIPTPKNMPGDLAAFTRAKFEPMVRGLFPRAEQDVVLATLEQSVVFVTSANSEPLLFKRATIGLRETRTKEWLLDIEYRKRETFAYSCEAYARVLERGMLVAVG